MPYPASVIAHAFVLKGIEEGNYVTQMKLQKMVYFAHGYHLAKYGKPLVNEDFEAWKFGPVVPEIYQSYKLYGSDYIIDPGLVPKSANPITLAESAQDAVDYTWRITKRLTAAELMNWTHVKDSPWAQVYDPTNISTVIGNEAIQSYFKKLIFTPAA